MKLKTISVILVLLLIAAVPICASASGDTDPLISLSYLTEIFAPSLKQEIINEVKDLISEQAPSADTPQEDTVVMLEKGQRIIPEYDSQVVMRGGKAYFIGSGADSYLTDLTSGTQVQSGAPLTAGHIYVTQGENDGSYILISEGGASVMLSGGNEIG